MKRKLFCILYALICVSPFIWGERLVISGGVNYPLIFSGTGSKKLHISVELDSPYHGIQLHATIKEAETGTIVDEKRILLKSLVQQDLSVPLLFPQWGYYKYEVCLRDVASGKDLAYANSTIAIVPKRKKLGPSDFGVCTHFGHFKGIVPYSMDLIRLAGFSTIRDEIFWDRVERPVGTFTFDPKYDNYVNAAVKRNIKVLMLLDYGNPAPGEKTAHGFPLDDSGRKRFARYAKEMATRYKDKIFLWELWNEPSKALGIDPGTTYFELLKEVYPAIKSVQPEGEVICSGGAPNLADGNYVNAIFKSGGADYMDGFAMHTYVAPYNPEDGYETTGHSFLKNVSVPSLWPHYGKMAEQNANGKSMGVWITEMGWHLADSLKTNKGELLFVDEYRQAAYATRLYLLSRRYDTTRAVYLYDFQNDGINPKEREHNFGIIRKDYSPKAAYPAIAVLSHLLKNKRFTKAMIETDKMKVFCYGEGKEEVIALWTVNHYADPLGQQPEEISLNLKAKKINLINWQGQSSVIRSDSGRYKIPITEMPSYIVMDRL